MKEKRGISFEKHEPTMNKGRNHLLIVGIDNYAHVSRLNNAVRDAETIRSILNEKYGYEVENTICLFNQEATRKNIYQTFRQIINKISKDDNLLIYYAGHGYYDLALNMGYWLPCEAEIDDYSNYIANSEISNFIKSIEAKHIFLIADACFAGSLFVNHRKTFNEKVEQHRSRWAFASGRMEAVSDGMIGQNSPFANSLIKVLGQNTEKEIRVSELILKVQVFVGNNFEQTPQGAPMYGVGDEGGEMVLRLKEEDYDEKEWEKVISSNTVVGFAQYITSFPNSKYIKEANDKLNEIKEKEKLAPIDDFTFSLCVTQDDFKKYIQLFPNGRNMEQAIEKIREVSKDFIREAKMKIAEGKTTTALNEVITYLSTKNIDSTNELIMLTSRLSSVQKDYRIGLLEHNSYSMEMARINHGFLTILDEIENSLKNNK